MGMTPQDQETVQAFITLALGWIAGWFSRHFTKKK